MGKLTKIRWSAAEILCPFYVSEGDDKRKTVCEGFANKLKVELRFNSLDDKDKHVGIYCASRFEDCPMYRCTFDTKYK